ncbi:hypothetical protein TNCV_1141851 [Trichonephila clavipes]|nr:hypothetical protein TNCV_1141851 [Trichonephila clavipes]
MVKDGKNNILVMMDYFTKWPEVYPISDQEALTVVEGVPFTTAAIPPSQMLFGRDFRLPADLLFSRPPDALLVPEEYVDKLPYGWTKYIIWRGKESTWLLKR